MLPYLWLFLWAAAEGSFFFVFPDTLLAPLAAAKPNKWWKFVLVCLLGSLTGSLIPFFLAKTNPELGLTILQNIALISPVKLQHVADLLNNLGYTAFLVQPFSLIPLKAFVFTASRDNYPVLAIAASLLVGRAIRNGLIAYVAGKLGTRYREVLQKNARQCLFAWIALCAALATIAIVTA